MDSVDIAKQRLRAHWYVDGLQELLGGAFLSLTALLVMASSHSGSATAENVGFAVLLLGALAAAIGIRVAKRRVTDPVVGRATERTAVRLRRVVLAFAWPAVAIPMLAAWENSNDFNPTVLALVAGAGFALSFLVHARVTGIRRFYAVAAFPPAAGVIAAVSHADARTSVLTIFLVTGLALAVSGALTLTRFLRARPAPEHEVA